MALFRNRPLALFCAFYAAAAVGGCFLSEDLLFPFFAAILCLSFMAFLSGFFLPRRVKMKIVTIGIAFLFASLSLLSFHFRIGKTCEIPKEWKDATLPVSVTVIRENGQASFHSSYIVSVDRIGESDIDSYAVLTFEGATDYHAGNRLLLSAQIQSIRESEFSDFAEYYLADGIPFVLLPDGPETIEPSDAPLSLMLRLAKINTALSKRITNEIDGEAGKLVSALFLGQKSLLDSSTIRDFRRAGLSHILAISGMHLSLLAFCVNFLLKKCYVPKKIRSVAVILFSVAYTLLTGASLSTVRALIMCLFVLLAFLLGKENDPVTSMFFSLFLILAILPWSVYDIGMWMSFSAVLGILMANELLESARGFLYDRTRSKRLTKFYLSVLTPVSIGFAASLFIVLPASLVFDEISLLSVLSSILVTPFVSVIPAFTIVLLLFPGFGFLSSVLAETADAFLSLVSALSRFSGITVSMHYPFWKVLIPVGTILLGILLLIPLEKKKRLLVPGGAVCVVIAFVLSLGVFRTSHNGEIAFDSLSVAESDMMVFSADATSVICDISTGAYTPASVAVRSGIENYSTEIGAYILTHYHSLSPSTVRSITGTYMVRRLYLPVAANSREYYDMLALLDIAAERNVPVTVYDRGKPFSVGTITFAISDEFYLPRSTHPTFFLTADTGKERICYVAESAHEADAFADVLPDAVGSADILILGNHGPITKTDFSYSPINADYVFIADGNLFSHYRLSSLPRGKIVLGSSRAHLTFLSEYE